jgi:hypothetical protein
LGAAGFVDSHGAKPFLLVDAEDDLLVSGRSFFSTLKLRCLVISQGNLIVELTWE